MDLAGWWVRVRRANTQGRSHLNLNLNLERRRFVCWLGLWWKKIAYIKEWILGFALDLNLFDFRAKKAWRENWDFQRDVPFGGNWKFNVKVVQKQNSEITNSGGSRFQFCIQCMWSWHACNTCLTWENSTIFFFFFLVVNSTNLFITTIVYHLRGVPLFIFVLKQMLLLCNCIFIFFYGIIDCCAVNDSFDFF